MEEKTALIRKISALLDQRIATAHAAMISARESKSNETKSSAGDKFETGRAMMQIEEEKHEMQWALLKERKMRLLNIPSETNPIIGQGALVKTNQGKYFISIGIGKLSFNDEIYFVISPESPIGQILIGKKKNDTIQFNARQIEIQEIV